MIKIRKSHGAPQSLTTTKKYDGEDVKRQLLSDQDSKCYLCERLLGTDFEIEHFAGREGNLINDWNNLLLSCGYCNRKKSNNYNNLLNPLHNNIEEKIQQRLNISTKKVDFYSAESSEEIESLKSLLGSIFNGVGKMRKEKEKIFYEDFVSKIDYFNELLLQYINDKTTENRDKVLGELGIDREFLGFKYWIIKDNNVEEFYDDIVWNKR
jgi:uncharacterized protein (TIGR02646 family)